MIISICKMLFRADSCMKDNNTWNVKTMDQQSLEERIVNLEKLTYFLRSEIAVLQKLIGKKNIDYYSPDRPSTESIVSVDTTSNSCKRDEALCIIRDIITQISPIQISDPFCSHLNHIKEKFIKFDDVISKINIDDIQDKIELLSGEILNVLDLFDDYFWGYSLETNQPMSSGIPDNMRSSAEKTRELIVQFLGLGLIRQIEFSEGEELNPDSQQYVLSGINPDKDERVIIGTLRPGFIKIYSDGDSMVFRKAIVKIR